MSNYNIKPQPPTGTVTMTVPDPGYGWMRAVSAQGVARLHEVYVNEDGSVAVYVVRPEGGPMNALQRWSTAEHEFPAWNLLDDDIKDASRWDAPRFIQGCAAELWALQQAHLETAGEMGWEL